MEISKITGTNKELATLDEAAIEKISKYHAKIASNQSVIDEPPLDGPLHAVLSNNSSEDGEVVGSIVGSTLSGILTLSITIIGAVGLGQPLWGLVPLVPAVILGVNGIRINSGKVGLFGLSQRSWVKMGLPAKKFNAARRENLANLMTYRKEAENRKHILAKNMKEIKPILASINARSLAYTFEFGEDGLVATPRPIPESIVKLNQEIAQIAAKENGA